MAKKKVEKTPKHGDALAKKLYPHIIENNPLKKKKDSVKANRMLAGYRK